jgi:hypothetical protein
MKLNTGILQDWTVENEVVDWSQALKSVESSEQEFYGQLSWSEVADGVVELCLPTILVMASANAMELDNTLLVTEYTRST